MPINFIAERLSARQLFLLHISFCVCMYVIMYDMYVCMYVCPSRLGMLIFCTQRALKVRTACTWPHYCQQGIMHEYSSMMDQSAQCIIDPTKDEGDRM